MHLVELGRDIHSLKNPRYIQNNATFEGNRNRLEQIRIEHDLGERQQETDNPYSRQAVIQHQLQKEGGND